jgi:hypothetical protein
MRGIYDLVNNNKEVTGPEIFARLIFSYTVPEEGNVYNIDVSVSQVKGEFGTREKPK